MCLFRQEAQWQKPYDDAVIYGGAFSKQRREASSAIVNPHCFLETDSPTALSLLRTCFQEWSGMWDVCVGSGARGPSGANSTGINRCCLLNFLHMPLK